MTAEIALTPWDGVKGSGAPYLRLDKLHEERTLTCRELTFYVLKRIHIDSDSVELVELHIGNGAAPMLKVDGSWEPPSRIGYSVRSSEDLTLKVRSITDNIVLFRIALLVTRSGAEPRPGPHYTSIGCYADRIGGLRFRAECSCGWRMEQGTIARPLALDAAAAHRRVNAS